jgi:hypothetical protein
MKADPYFTAIHKYQLKIHQRLKNNPETIKVLKENSGKVPSCWAWQDFFGFYTKN